MQIAGAMRVSADSVCLIEAGAIVFNKGFWLDITACLVYYSSTASCNTVDEVYFGFVNLFFFCNNHCYLELHFHKIK